MKILYNFITHGGDILVPSLDSLLLGHQLVVTLLGDGGPWEIIVTLEKKLHDYLLALPAVSGLLIKLLAQPELELDTLHGGLGGHGPVAAILGDGHHWSARHGGLPQHEANIERLQ